MVCFSLGLRCVWGMLFITVLIDVPEETAQFNVCQRGLCCIDKVRLIKGQSPLLMLLLPFNASRFLLALVSAAWPQLAITQLFLLATQIFFCHNCHKDFRLQLEHTCPYLQR